MGDDFLYFVLYFNLNSALVNEEYGENYITIFIMEIRERELRMKIVFKFNVMLGGILRWIAIEINDT